MSKRADSEDGAEGGSGWRGSRALWLQAAKQAFLESGLDAVKIQLLAARLNISRASFYWFFRDRQALLDAGYSDTQVGAILGGNPVRVMRQVQALADPEAVKAALE